VFVLNSELAARLIAHAAAERPRECCGVVAAVNGRALAAYPARNVAPEPDRFSMHPQDLYDLYRLCEENGWDFCPYHSHPRGPACPSDTDRVLALWPDALQIIVSLQGVPPEVRAFYLRADAVVEEEVRVEGAPPAALLP